MCFASAISCTLVWNCKDNSAQSTSINNFDFLECAHVCLFCFWVSLFFFCEFPHKYIEMMFVNDWNDRERTLKLRVNVIIAYPLRGEFKHYFVSHSTKNPCQKCNIDELNNDHKGETLIASLPYSRTFTYVWCFSH